MANTTYEHKCPYCLHKWIGKKQIVVSCVRCKRRLDYAQKAVPGRADAVRFIETNLIRAGMHPQIARSEAKRKLNNIIGFGGK
jgi:hypothetical protein